jgi:predicted GIY-YIG superfamily endonuclease
MYYFYVLQDELGQVYFGSTNDLKRRLGERQNGKSFATKGKNWELVYYEAYFSEGDDREREHNVKHNGGTKKDLLKRITRSRQRESKGRG